MSVLQRSTVRLRHQQHFVKRHAPGIPAALGETAPARMVTRRRRINLGSIKTRVYWFWFAAPREILA
jgi:hypothetical protein